MTADTATPAADIAVIGTPTSVQSCLGIWVSIFVYV